MLGVLTPNTTERATLSSYKFIGAFAGGIVVTACLLNSPRWRVAARHHPEQAGGGIRRPGRDFDPLLLDCVFNTKERVQPPKAQQTVRFSRTWAISLPTGLVVLLARRSPHFLLLAARQRGDYYFSIMWLADADAALVLPASIGRTQVGAGKLVDLQTSNQALSMIGAFLFLHCPPIGGKPTFVLLFAIAIGSTAHCLVAPSRSGLSWHQCLGSISGGPSAPHGGDVRDTAELRGVETGRRATRASCFFRLDLCAEIRLGLGRRHCRFSLMTGSASWPPGQTPKCCGVWCG